MTNLERIQTMTDREMAAFMKALELDKIDYCDHDVVQDKNYNTCNIHDCTGCRIKWLQSPYEGKAAQREKGQEDACRNTKAEFVASSPAATEKNPASCKIYEAMSVACGKPYDCRKCPYSCSFKDRLSERDGEKVRAKAGVPDKEQERMRV